MGTANGELGVRFDYSMFTEDKADMAQPRDVRLVRFRVNDEVGRIRIIIKLTRVIKPPGEAGFVEGRNSASAEPGEGFTRYVKRLNPTACPRRRKDDRIHR